MSLQSHQSDASESSDDLRDSQDLQPTTEDLASSSRARLSRDSHHEIYEMADDQSILIQDFSGATAGSRNASRYAQNPRNDQFSSEEQAGVSLVESSTSRPL